MHFANHSNLEGLHAPFSPSQPYWLRYDDERLLEFLTTQRAAQKGTELHEWAKRTIELGLTQSKSEQTIFMYVNDALRFHMKPEQPLVYSANCWGTADAITFNKNVLRIHDLITGVGKVHREQLEVYAALFCLEYHKNPMDIRIILRIYQNNAIDEWEPDPDVITHNMDRIIYIDRFKREFDGEED